MKKPTVRVRRNGGRKPASPQSPAQPELQSPEITERFKGSIESFYPGCGSGFIMPENDVLERMAQSGRAFDILGVKFNGNDVERFDVFRLSFSDYVEFSLVRDGNDWRAVKISVLESCAQQHEHDFSEDRTVLLTQSFDLRIAGFKMSDLMYRRMCAAALGGFMHAAIMEKIERQERAFDAGGRR